MQKNINSRFFAVSSPKISIYTQPNSNQINQINQIHSNFHLKNQRYQTNQKSKSHQFLYKDLFHKKTMASENNQNNQTNLTRKLQKNQSTRKLQKNQSTKTKSKFQFFKKVQNKNNETKSTKKNNNYQSLNDFGSRTRNFNNINAISSLSISRSNKILSQKYKFSLYTSIQNNQKQYFLKSKSSSQRNKKIQNRSYTKNPYLKGLNSEKNRIYQNWQRIRGKIQQAQIKDQQQGQIKNYLYASNIKIQCYSKQEQVFAKFFICQNCLQIFLIIQANNHNQVCQLIYSNQQLQEKLYRVGALLKALYRDYYQERFKYKCYLETSELIQKVLIICNQKTLFLKNLNGTYSIQQLDVIMETIQKNMLKKELESQKYLFQSIHSLIRKDKFSLKQLFNQKDLFWLIGKLLQKIAFEKLTQYWKHSVQNKKELI